MSGLPEPAPGTLYLVGTPIGNLDDLSPRARRILGSVDCLAAEDTRHTQGMLARFEIRRPLVSYHDHNKERRTPELIRRLEKGDSVAIVSDAGSPGISDPAFTLAREAIRAGHSVVSIPGPSALIGALEVSGLPTDRFAFEGFLPRRKMKREARIQALRRDPRTLIFFESPHRLAACVGDLLAGLGDRPASVSRELTKRFEETRRGRLSEILAWIAERPPRGEYVLVVGGSPGGDDKEPEGSATGDADEEASDS